MFITRLWYQLRLTARLLRDERVPLLKKIIPFLGLVYVLSPLDIIPDFIIGLGQLDDVGVVLLSLRLFARSLPPELVQEHRDIMDGKVLQNVTVSSTAYQVKRPQATPRRQA
ncbi:MAG: DUF1232 domain-containing protein [Armatimonadetes bacterium]|nr:DUF1232 domain-containing protein [Anaerolineae bacterium]